MERLIPTQADIDAAIEDFYTDVHDTAVEPDNLAESVDSQRLTTSDESATTATTIEEAHKILAELTKEHADLCRQAKQLLIDRAQGRQRLTTDASRLNETETRYRASLKQWPQLTKAKAETEQKYRQLCNQLTKTLNAKQEHVRKIKDAFERFSLATVSGLLKQNKAAMQEIKALTTEEKSAAKAMHAERQESLRLDSERIQLEKILSDRDRLGDGLHLMDFEQLTVENQALQEKIEERDIELHRLRKKTSGVVQVLAHVSEKLHFVKRHILFQEESIQHKTETLSRQKINEQSLKMNCNIINRRTEVENHICQRVTHSELLEDIDRLSVTKSRLMDILQGLKEQYASSQGCNE